MGVLLSEYEYAIGEIAQYFMSSFPKSEYSCNCFSPKDAETLGVSDEDGSLIDELPSHFFSNAEKILIIYKKTDNRSSILGFKFGKSKDDRLPIILVNYDEEEDLFKVALAANAEFLDIAFLLSYISKKFENLILQDLFTYIWDNIGKYHKFFFGAWNVCPMLDITRFPNDSRHEKNIFLEALRRTSGKTLEISTECLENESSFCLLPEKIEYLVNDYV